MYNEFGLKCVLAWLQVGKIWAARFKEAVSSKGPRGLYKHLHNPIKVGDWFQQADEHACKRIGSWGQKRAGTMVAREAICNPSKLPKVGWQPSPVTTSVQLV